MKRTKFSPTQIAGILMEFDTAKPLDAIIRENVISKPTFYNWCKKYGGLEATELKRIKELEEENAR